MINGLISEGPELSFNVIGMELEMKWLQYAHNIFERRGNHGNAG